MLAINRIAPTACTSATANAALDRPVEHREQPVDEVLLVQYVQHAGLAGHRIVEVLVLLGIIQLDDERRRERVLPRDILVLRELLDRVVVGVLAVQEPNGANVVARLDLRPQRLAGIGVTGRVVGRDVVGQEHLALDPVQVDVAGVVGEPHHQQAAAEQTNGDRGGQDHRDRHGDVATKAGPDLVEQEAEAH